MCLFYEMRDARCHSNNTSIVDGKQQKKGGVIFKKADTSQSCIPVQVHLG